MAKLFPIQWIVLSSTVILFLGILIKHLHAEFSAGEQNLKSSKFAERVQLRHMVLSDVNLISTQNTRSKLKCATLCDLDEKCKMFRFEAPSGSWYLYREVITGGCFASTSRNVSSYYTHLGARSQSLDVDPVHRRLFYDGGDFVGMVDLDNNKTSVFEGGDGKIDDIRNVRVLPDLRFVFWIDNYKLWRRHYDESKPHQIAAFQKKDDRLTTDHLCKSVHLGDYQIQYGIVDKTLNFVITPLPENIYSDNRLIWVKAGTTVLLFTNAWGEDQIRVTLSGLIGIPSVPTVFTINGNIYIFGYDSYTITMFNCRGDLLANLTPTGKSVLTDTRELVWIPEHVYYNV